ncbi:hypothetical protein PR048_012249 [Dryococelus australis]|uniref:Uncharacterized protein n=1 Tax=Dryococelus australis TaxID=614101 RepID=A0ABQ9HQ43_9NEOP|nr:hypothetical protein PR048_012249 [Dryococelus australis]
MDGGCISFPPPVLLLGYSTYPLKERHIPPPSSHFRIRRHPGNYVEIRFNPMHKKNMRLIENALGILEEKFPGLNYFRMEPLFAKNGEKCCTVLCKISRSEQDLHRGLVDDNDYDDCEVMEVQDIHERVEYAWYEAGNDAQNRLNY